MPGVFHGAFAVSALKSLFEAGVVWGRIAPVWP